MTAHTSPPPLPWDGGCRCDALRIRVSAPPLITMACHCTGCQRMSASAFSLTLIVAPTAFEVTAGEPVVGGLRSDDLQHMFCGACMTWVFTRPVGFPFVNVRPTMLDEAGWFAPFAETCAAEKLPWATTGAVRSFERFPSNEDFGPLIGEYCAWAGARGIPVPEG